MMAAWVSSMVPCAAWATCGPILDGCPLIPEGDIGVRTVDDILEALMSIENEVEGELLRRPVPTGSDERDIRARVLADRHLRCHGIDGFHDLVRML